MRAIETPLSSPKGTMWCLYDPTSSYWFKMDAHFTASDPKIEINILRIFQNLIENDKSKDDEEVLDKSIFECIKMVENKKAVEGVEDSDSYVSVNEGSTRWGKYVDRLMEMPRSQPIGYYLKHEINKKMVENLIDSHKYNDSLLVTHLGKMDNETYNSLPVGPMYNEILKKKIAKKDGR
ncbi:hypothetical protein Tco_1004806 [Tanacetum coccineum]|uniref:Uncharacterized protein n=1 Tax=Tanacetum coccineum TaxID=301880 RepID=A0ABQ5FDM3_9ASTR